MVTNDGTLTLSVGKLAKTLMGIGNEQTTFQELVGITTINEES